MQCEWYLEPDLDQQCQEEGTVTFVMPDSDSLDAITFLCPTHADEFESEPNAAYHEGWVRS